MSKCLTEDAKRYIDDFLSNVEDIDLILHYGESEAVGCSTRSTSLPIEMDGVVLQWLQWETGNDGSPLLCKSKEEVSRIPEDISYGSLQVHMMNDANILEAIQLINVDAARHHVLDSLHPFFTLNWSVIQGIRYGFGYGNCGPFRKSKWSFECALNFKMFRLLPFLLSVSSSANIPAKRSRKSNMQAKATPSTNYLGNKTASIWFIGKIVDSDPDD
ncbi:hypothetical protein IFM89_005920 [Coptis chinensis]|uniref:Uncharacterized protein n=1 Tax=Coptis chinensis TaxID=261450 RepID=A0A835M3Z4_9MAGN|nr:hypothetical protein IFM89_005920 [Coptis chinensis]